MTETLIVGGSLVLILLCVLCFGAAGLLLLALMVAAWRMTKPPL